MRNELVRMGEAIQKPNWDALVIPEIETDGTKELEAFFQKRYKKELCDGIARNKKQERRELEELNYLANLNPYDAKLQVSIFKAFGKSGLEVINQSLTQNIFALNDNSQLWSFLVRKGKHLKDRHEKSLKIKRCGLWGFCDLKTYWGKKFNYRNDALKCPLGSSF